MEENTSPQETPQKEEQTEFKKPVLIGRIGKLPRKAKPDPEKAPEESNVVKSSETTSDTKPKVSLPPAVLLKELSTPIPYKEPKWSGICPDGSDYALEVLKSGMIVDRIDLTKKPFFVFGRLANCDVVMAHPTISRHHAVLQYKAFAEEGEPPSGWYMYDLGSTHGSFLNKERVKSGHYTRVRVGHMIKFGASTRTYIVLGPDFDTEGETELSVTEIKKRAEHMRLERDRMIREAVEQRERDREEEERKREQQGIDWGMGEDAEEEPDLAENPFASTANEELYLEDPKKTLRGYFEREGHELTYNCEERGPGQFICRVELPMDDARGRPVVAEVIHRGKKKEAVIACALEACRMLDRAGLLRQAKHESRRRKQRDWSADDYYDSDEDTFLDRTGSVERKRKLRMRKHGGEADEEKPLTYDDLVNKITDIQSKITSEEKTLERLRSSSKLAKEEASEIDALDEFMSSLGRQGQSMAQRADISKAKMSIQKLRGELSQTRRLAHVARPALLPPLLKRDDKLPVKVANSVVYGKRIRLKEDAERKHRVKKEIKQDEGEFVEEVDSDEEEDKSEEQNAEVQRCNTEIPRSNTEIPKSDTEVPRNDTEDPRSNTENPRSDTEVPRCNTEVLRSNTDQGPSKEVKVEETSEPKRVFGPMRPPENYVIPESYFDQETDRDVPEIMED